MALAGVKQTKVASSQVMSTEDSILKVTDLVTKYYTGDGTVHTAHAVSLKGKEKRTSRNCW